MPTCSNTARSSSPAAGRSAFTRRAWRFAGCARRSACSRVPSTDRSCGRCRPRAKWLAGECAPARDLLVFLDETVADVPPVVRRIGNRLAKIHLERARTALSGARFEGFHRQLDAFATLSPAATAGRLDEFAGTVLDTRHDKVLKRGRKLGSLDEGGCTGCASPSRSCATPLPSCGRPLRRLWPSPISRRRCACRARSAP